MEYKIYVDACIQHIRHLNENHALTDIVDRSPAEAKVIVIADMNYESYNILLISNGMVGIM